jgi:hypothetical protein
VNVSGGASSGKRRDFASLLAVMLVACSSRPLPPYQLPKGNDLPPGPAAAPITTVPAVRPVAAAPAAPDPSPASTVPLGTLAVAPAAAVSTAAVPVSAAPPPAAAPVSAASPPPPVPSSPGSGAPLGMAQQILADGIHEYSLGLYAAATQSLRDALQAGLADPIDQVSAHKFLALALCVGNQLPECKAEFRRALVLYPGLVLDPAEAADPRIGPVFASAKVSR